MISIKCKKRITKLFDKMCSFSFLIVSMPYLDCSIPFKVFYSAFGAKILRSPRTTNDATIICPYQWYLPSVWILQSFGQLNDETNR